MINSLIERYKKRFEITDEDGTLGDTYAGNLRLELSKLSYMMFLMLFVWLIYIPVDMILHQFPVMVAALRIGMSVVSALMLLSRFSEKLCDRPDVMFMVTVTYLFLGTAVITATAGEQATSYMGGLIFIILIPVFLPLPRNFLHIVTTFTVFLFFVIAALIGMDFESDAIRYNITDLIIAYTISQLLTYILDRLRFNAWEQRMKLKVTIEENENSLKTIFTLANKAEASDRAKSNFLAAMSHEIRTPMNVILGITQIELQKGDMSKEREVAFNKIYSSGTTLLRLINDILDFSKIEAGKMELTPINYDIPSLINDAVQLNVVRIGSKPIEFKLEVDEELPMRFIGDDLRIKQILNNLLSNAIKYTQKGYIKLSVKYSPPEKQAVRKVSASGVPYRTDGDPGIIFIVEDTGKGIKPEDLKKLFTEYRRFDIETNYATEGTGIGLHITRNLVKLMDGEITVESEYGKGSTFTALVRQKAVECEPIGVELANMLSNFSYSVEEQLADAQVRREPMPYGKVLIVDDLETNLYVAEGMLTLYELDVDTALSGYEALAKVEEGNLYDVIFMDHMMPMMDGVETVKKIRELGYRGTIAALTANAMAGNIEMLKQNGFDDFISKPIDARYLNAMLKKYIRDKHPQEAEQYKNAAIEDDGGENILSEKIIAAFCRDASGCVSELREAFSDRDAKRVASAAHGVKPILANIGESAMSAQALAIETAGKKFDWSYIDDNTQGFIKDLEALIERLLLSIAHDDDDDDESGIEEDLQFLGQRLQKAYLACGQYDDLAVYEALDALIDKKWKRETAAAIEKIRDMIYTNSDFDGAAEKIEKLLKRIG